MKNNMLRVFTITLLFFLIACLAKAQEPAQKTDETAAKLPAVEELVVTTPGNVTLDFRDADIRNVLRIISYKSGVNIVPGPDVTGLITIQLTDVPWEKALDVILKTYGYGYERQGNIITVSTFEKLSEKRKIEKELAEQEPLVTEVFILSYAKSKDLMASLKEMLTTRGRINVDERTNTIIVTDNTTNMERIRSIMPNLDAVTPQVLIEAKVVETRIDSSDKLGIDWTAKATASLPQRPVLFPFDSSSTSRYAPDNFPSATSTEFKFGTLNFSQFQAVLELLSSRTDTNILSNPRIVTLDNQTASITVGTKWPIAQYTYNADQAKWQVSGWEYLDFGILLKVTPHVNKEGFVTLDVAPEVSEQNGSVTFETATIPILTTQETSTRVMIKDGETLIIAGLLKDKTIATKKKIPFLGDIPIVGLIFQKRENTIEKKDLLIFITPHIITPVATPKA
ncbi:MAG: type IV pilus secretin PilQ [Candidatus Omnitrophota bacterium]|nr:type IV pilus secretin PilQ [Candidatus Omnitrophota bacterium]